MASTCKFALAVCQAGFESCQDALDDIAGFVALYPDPNKATADSMIASDKCDRIRTGMEDASSASATADDACKQANEKAKLGDDLLAGKEMLRADAARKIALGAAMEVQGVFAQVQGVKNELMSDIMTKDFEVRDASLEKLEAEEEEKYQNTTKVIEKEMKRLQDKMAKEKVAQEKEKLRNEVDALKELLERRKRRREEIRRGVKRWHEQVKDEISFAKQMDKKNFQMATAAQLDAWLEEYRQLLQSAIPNFIYDTYSTTVGGCLDPNFESYFNVTVEMVQVPKERDTLIEECESNR
jgi:hypothetical protein